jgi:hypothetical protein
MRSIGLKLIRTCNILSELLTNFSRYVIHKTINYIFIKKISILEPVRTKQRNHISLNS